MDKKKTKIVVCGNQKGGVGKTSLVINLADCMYELGKKCLIIDVDPQGNIGEWLKIKNRLTTANLFTNDQYPLEEYIVNYNDMFDVIISNNSLAKAEKHITGELGRESILARTLEEALITENHQYDYIILDTSPSLSLLNQNSYMAADYIIIPTELEQLSLLGVDQTLENILLLNKLFKHPIEVIGVIPSKASKQTRIARQVLERAERKFKEKLMLPGIRKSVIAIEANALHQTVGEYSPTSKLRNDYMKVSKSIVDYVGAEKKDG